MFREATDKFAIELNSRIHDVVIKVIVELQDKGSMSANNFAGMALYPNIVSQIVVYAKGLSWQMGKLAFNIIPLFREAHAEGAEENSEKMKAMQFLIRERIVKMILETLGKSKPFAQFSVPLLAGLKFEKPDWFGDFQEAD